MTNSPNNRLDEFIKNSMESYQVPFNEAHWNEFEAQLNSKPRANTFRKWNFSMNTIIGAVIAGSAAVLAYLAISLSSGNKNTVNTATSAVNDAVTTTSKKEVSTTPVNNTAANNAPVINTLNENNTYSIFTSADISGTSDMNVQELMEKSDNSFSGINNNNGVLNSGITPLTSTGITANNNTTASTTPTVTNNVSGYNNAMSDKIDPTELRKILQEANDMNAKDHTMFPDQFDKKYGRIYGTKESDTIKDKAKKELDNSPFTTTDKDGNRVVDVDSMKKFLDNVKDKDSNVTPSDTTKHE